MVRRNRILIATTRAERGGAPKHVVDLIGGLREKYELCLAIGEEGHVVDKVRKAGVPVHIIPSLQRNISPFKDLRAIYSFSKLVKSFQPDLIHGHSFKAGMLSRFARALNRVPVVYTPHGRSVTDRARKVWQVAAPLITLFDIQHVLLGELATIKVLVVLRSWRTLARVKRVLDSKNERLLPSSIFFMFSFALVLDIFELDYGSVAKHMVNLLPVLAYVMTFGDGRLSVFPKR